MRLHPLMTKISERNWGEKFQAIIFKESKLFYKYNIIHKEKSSLLLSIQELKLYQNTTINFPHKSAKPSTPKPSSSSPSFTYCSRTSKVPTTCDSRNSSPWLCLFVLIYNSLSMKIVVCCLCGSICFVFVSEFSDCIWYVFETMPNLCSYNYWSLYFYCCVILFFYLLLDNFQICAYEFSAWMHSLRLYLSVIFIIHIDTNRIMP